MGIHNIEILSERGEKEIARNRKNRDELKKKSKTKRKVAKNTRRNNRSK